MLLGAVVLINLILIACNTFYETDGNQEKTKEFESQLNKRHKM